MAETERKKKKDYAALQSPFMRIPQMKIDIARHLLDIGISQIYQLEGRSPESLLSEIIRRKGAGNVADDVLAYLRMAVYYAESEEPDARKLYPTEWM